MKPAQYEAIYRTLLERFGEPIGDNQGVPTSSKKKDMGNRGFGAKLDESGTCQRCGMMQDDVAGDHDCGMDQATAIEGDDHMDESDLDEVTPPGGEKVVKALKHRKGVKNPWAVAWSMKNKGEF